MSLGPLEGRRAFDAHSSSEKMVRGGTTEQRAAVTEAYSGPPPPSLTPDVFSDRVPGAARGARAVPCGGRRRCQYGPLCRRPNSRQHNAAHKPKTSTPSAPQMSFTKNEQQQTPQQQRAPSPSLTVLRCQGGPSGRVSSSPSCRRPRLAGLELGRTLHFPQDRASPAPPPLGPLPLTCTHSTRTRTRRPRRRPPAGRRG